MKKYIEKSDLGTEIELCLRTKRSCELSLAAIQEVYEKNDSRLQRILRENSCKKVFQGQNKIIYTKDGENVWEVRI